MVKKIKLQIFSKFQPLDKQNHTVKFFFTFGLWALILGEIILVFQVILRDIGRWETTQIFNPNFWDFNDNIENILVALVPILVTMLSVLALINSKPTQTTLLAISSVLFSASLFVGGGWFVGAILGLIGTFFVGLTPSIQKLSPSRISKRNYRILVGMSFSVMIIAMVLIPFLFTYPLLPPYLFNQNLYEGQSGAPNENNTMYMLVTWESTVISPSEMDDYKQKMGPGGDYFKMGIAFSCWYAGHYYNATNTTFNPDNLYLKLNNSINYNIPILIHMNGGNWGMAGMASGIVNDSWYNDSECQWDQHDNIPDPAPAPGGLRDRLFTLSKYSNIYKHRESNIKVAGAIIKNFSDNYPELFVGVSLDSEIHLDYDEKDDDVLYYDYNPHVIREFQEWLVTRYSGIQEFNDKFGLGFTSFSTVDPPRQVNVGEPYWEEWTVFRRFHVKQNVEAQAGWLREIGIPRNRIYSHQILKPVDHHVSLYGWCCPIETADIDNGTLGITSYDYMEPSVLKLNYDLAGFNWGIFEWNLRSTTVNLYEKFTTILKMFYQYGVRVICPWAWYAGPFYWFYNLQNNTEFQRAVRDFSALIGDSPRGTDQDGFLKLEDYAGKFFDEWYDFFNDEDNAYYLLIPLGVIQGAFWTVKPILEQVGKKRIKSRGKSEIP
ncbi:MAG: beta-galactosidase [Candidatus Hodarchaeota archaeon]